MRKINKFAMVLIVLALCIQVYDAAFAKKINWNDKKLTWLSYDKGMTELRATGQPGILIIYADWCPTCEMYAKLFTSPDVVKELQGLVLIRVNQDQQREVSKKYGLDGEYVPRTFALSSGGEIMKGVYEKKDKYWYYLPANDPNYLIQFARSVKSANSQGTVAQR